MPLLLVAWYFFFLSFLCVSQQGEFKNAIRTLWKSPVLKTFYNFFEGVGGGGEGVSVILIVRTLPARANASSTVDIR
jgi:hypothetical protein